MYELFDHTADLGLRVVADDLDGLFREAAEGFFAVVVETLPESAPQCTLEFRLEAERLDHLLVDWLNELLYVFDTRRLLLGSFEVSIEGRCLTASAAAHPLAEAGGGALREVKAVTYHGLRVERAERGWLAEVILDI